MRTEARDRAHQRERLQARCARGDRRAPPHATLITLTFLVFCPLACSAAGKITLGVVNWIGYGPIYCAAANGFYKRHGADVKLVTFSDNSLMPGALEGGELDASTLTYDQVIAAAAKGWRLKVVMPLDYSVGGDAILSSGAVRSIKDLKGRKVAFQPLSPSDFLLGYALAQAGLSRKDIQAVNSTPEGVVAIMATGQVDAGVTYQPSVSMILKLEGGKRYHVLLSSREARGMITDVLAFRENTIAKDPKLVDGLIRGTMDGLAFMRQQPDKAIAIISKALEISADEVRAQLPNVENPPLAQLSDVFRKTTSLPSFHASGAVIGDLLRKEGQIDRAPSIEGTYDSSFVSDVQAKPGDLR
jgi:NitT/TauT family transport system substrate-binding protein